MVTNDNDEIKQKASEKEWDYSASFKDKADDYENYLMNEARADTAKQIFKEMESKGVLVHREAIEGTKKNNYVRFKASVYQALKKKHNIEE